MEIVGAGKVILHLTQIDVGQAHPALGTRQRAHVGDDFHLGYDLALLHTVARLLEQLGDDAADLGLDVHLIAWLYLASDDGGFLNVLPSRCELRIDHRLGLALLPEEHERSDENGGNDSCHNQLDVLLHTIFMFIVFFN